MESLWWLQNVGFPTWITMSIFKHSWRVVFSLVQKFLNILELGLWLCAINVNLTEKCLGFISHGFLGNRKDDIYEELADTLLDSNGCRMSIKLHYLPSHLDFFSPSMGSISEEHGERFHLSIRTMELRNQERWTMLWWGIIICGTLFGKTSECTKEYQYQIFISD